MFQQSLSYFDKFEVYLEGIKIPFISFSISEAEGNVIPAAQISIPSNFNVIRILPGTIVQIFGKVLNPYTELEEFLLLFEGKITSLTYQSNAVSNFVSLSASSLLSNFIKAKIRPSDVIITKQREEFETGTNTDNSENSDNFSDTGDSEVSSGELKYKFTTYNKEEILDQSVNYEIDKKMLESDKDQVLSKEGTANELGNITMLGGLADEFMKYFSEGGKCSDGNFLPIVNDFIDFFESSDLYFGIESRSFRTKESLFAFPNKNVIKPFQYKCLNEALQLFQQNTVDDLLGSEERLNLINVFQHLNDYLFYQLVYPSAYPHVLRFYTVSGIPTAPLRAFFSPYLESGPPALCNIFFPENINSFSFVRNMEAEPTRLISQADFSNVAQGKLTNVVNPIYLAPSVPVIYESGLRSNFTLEESFRGINLKVSKFNAIVGSLYMKNDEAETTSTSTSTSTSISGISQLNFNPSSILSAFSAATTVSTRTLPSYTQNLISNTNTNTSTNTSTNTNSVNINLADLISESEVDYELESEYDTDKLGTELDSFMKSYTLNEFLKLRYANRQANVVTEWNPYRILGLPALIFFPNKPCIIGIITSIQTNVDSRGNATCSYTLRNCRIIIDEDYQSVFKNLSSTNSGLSKFVLNDYSDNNISLLNEYLYNPELYRFTKIGYTLYEYLINGSGIEFNKHLSVVRKDDKFNGPFIDYSILTFIRNYSSSNSKNFEFDYTKLPDLKLIPEKSLSFKYNYILYRSIYYLKLKYLELRDASEENLTDKSPLYKFISKLNWRRIITKNEYLKYIGAVNDINYLYVDSKDLYSIFKKKHPRKLITFKYKSIDFSEYNVENRQEFFSAIVNKSKNKNFYIDVNYVLRENIDMERYYSVVDTNQNSIDSVSEENSVYRPYNIIRKAHVFYTFYQEKSKWRESVTNSIRAN